MSLKPSAIRGMSVLLGPNPSVTSLEPKADMNEEHGHESSSLTSFVRSFHRGHNRIRGVRHRKKLPIADGRLLPAVHPTR